MSEVATQDAATSVSALETAMSEREVEIIRAAYRVASSRGCHRMSLQDVADLADVSKGLVLYHFQSKSNLLLTTMRWALLTVAERIEGALAEAEDPVTALDAILAILYVDPPRNRAYQLLYIDLVEYAARDDDFSELAQLTEQVVNGVFARMIAWGRDDGVFDVDDPDEAAAVMRAVVEGSFVAWLPRRDWEQAHAELRPRTRATLHALFGVS